MQKKKSTLKYIFCLCVQIEALEQMVDMTAKLFECDRDEMYNYLLRLCSKSFPFICLCALLFGFSVCGFDLQTAPPPTSSSVATFHLWVCLLSSFPDLECAAEWDQSEVSRRHGVIAALESRTDNACDWSVKADCRPITLPTHTHAHTTSWCVW